MADSEILLQPEILAELERYRTLERRVQVSSQQCQEFKELAKQVTPRNTPPLASSLRDGSPAAELDATLSALRQQIETIHQIEAQLYEQQSASHKPSHKSQIPPPSQAQLTMFRINMKIALYVISTIVLLFLLLTLLHSMTH
jgi:hypothetical protein